MAARGKTATAAGAADPDHTAHVYAQPRIQPGSWTTMETGITASPSVTGTTAVGDSDLSVHCADAGPPRPLAKETQTHRAQCQSGGSACQGAGTEVWYCGAPWHTQRREGGGWSVWLAQDIGTMEMVPSLVLQAFSTGVLDATTYADFLTFASNQTGNTILLCVAAIGTTTNATDPAQEQARLVLTAISLGTFLLCAAIFGHLGHFMGVRRRAWLILTNTLQILSLMIAAILLSPVSPPAFRVGGTHSWLVLALFAGMSGAQVAQARQSGSQELPTAPMTSSYVDLMADRYLLRSPWHPGAGPRNRRVAYIIAMIAGGMLGAVIHRWAGSWETVVVTLALKVVVLLWTCALRGETRGVMGEAHEAEKGLSAV